MPLQLMIMIAMVLTLMFITWLTLANPDLKEGNKAQMTAQYYLDALGRAPIDKLGAELHPEPRKQFNPDSLNKHLADLQLNQIVKVNQLRDELFQKEPAQWSWRADLSAPTGKFPLLIAVRKPQEQTIARRWRIYSLCRPDLDLMAQSKVLLNQKDSPLQKFAGFANFKAQPESSWKWVGWSPITLVIPGQDKKLQLSWTYQSNDKLGCDYQLLPAKWISAR